jgi:hypothetical protein
MKVTEIIRGILDVIDSVERDQFLSTSQKPSAYSDKDIKRFRQIVDLADTETNTVYSNEPQEQYADIDAVTQDAGADSWQGTKHPADIRGEHPSLYPGRVYGSK